MSLKFYLAMSLSLILMILGNIIILNAEDTSEKAVTLTGRFIAYPMSSRLFQLPSIQCRTEIYLFLVENANQNDKPEIVKIVYRFTGESEIFGDTFNNAPLLRLELTRKKDCDETFSHFKENARVLITDKSTGNVVGSYGDIVYQEQFKDIQIVPEQQLSCFLLPMGGMKIVK
jgi:hypothetical protein